MEPPNGMGRKFFTVHLLSSLISKGLKIAIKSGVRVDKRKVHTEFSSIGRTYAATWKGQRAID